MSCRVVFTSEAPRLKKMYSSVSNRTWFLYLTHYEIPRVFMWYCLLTSFSVVSYSKWDLSILRLELWKHIPQPLHKIRFKQCSAWHHTFLIKKTSSLTISLEFCKEHSAVSVMILPSLLPPFNFHRNDTGLTWKIAYFTAQLCSKVEKSILCTKKAWLSVHMTVRWEVCS